MPAPKGGKKKVMNLKDLSQEQQLLFTGKDGSDTKEWTAWLTKEACDVLDMKQSEEIRPYRAYALGADQQKRRPCGQGVPSEEQVGDSRVQGLVPWLLSA